MKKIFVILVLIVAVCFLTCCNNSPKEYVYDEDFAEFSIDGNLSWLQGTWKLDKWTTVNNGVEENNTDIYEYKQLVIQGTTKDAVLLEQGKSKYDTKPFSYEYTVQSYLTLNNHEQGHSNQVNKEKSMLLLIRQSYLGPQVLYYTTYKKQK